MTKQEKYIELVPQIKALIESESDLIANLANLVAVLKYELDFFWVGFYFVKPSGFLLEKKQEDKLEEKQELVLGPFQGPIACTRIAYGKGVCGTAWKKQETIIVPDVHQFEGHIACNAQSQSEIVIPVLKDAKVWMVLDVDSDKLNNFDETDVYYLEEITILIEKKYTSLSPNRFP